MQWGGGGRAGLLGPPPGALGLSPPSPPVSPSCTHHTQEARIPQAPPCPKQEEMQLGPAGPLVSGEAWCPGGPPSPGVPYRSEERTGQSYRPAQLMEVHYCGGEGWRGWKTPVATGLNIPAGKRRAVSSPSPPSTIWKVPDASLGLSRSAWV